MINEVMEKQREVFRNIAQIADEYAGIPIRLEGERLVIHPSYRFAPVYNKEASEEDKEAAKDFVNHWYSHRLKKEIYIFRENGRSIVSLLPMDEGFEIERLLRTYGLNSVWELAAERRALDKFGELVEHHKFRGYLLTGTFIETSKKSKVTYLFRKNRPTIALSTSQGYAKFLCSLCLHPIGYYDKSYAGSMVPTDEIIAHLILMRGDEHAFWKYSNQHQTI